MGLHTFKALEGSCQSEMSDAISVLITGLAEDSPTVEVYLKPVSDYLRVNAKSFGIAQIYDLKGNVIKKEYITTLPFQMDVHELPSGMYLLRIPGSSKLSKFVKE